MEDNIHDIIEKLKEAGIEEYAIRVHLFVALMDAGYQLPATVFPHEVIVRRTNENHPDQ